MTKRASHQQQEVIFNFWLISHDTDIMGLRMQHYVATGSDEEKERMLQERSRYDYYTATEVQIPQRFHIHRLEGEALCRVPVVKPQALPVLGGPLALFEDAMQALEATVLKQQNLRVPEDPLSCITWLIADDEGTLSPRIDSVVHS